MRTFIALLALVGCAYGQTYKTVTADTNNVIRTNFSLVRSQVSDLSGATFAISNVTGLQTALDGKLATNGSAAGLSNFPASLLTTNGSAAGLTNFPSSVLQTNSALSAFPSGLLRTNGDGGGLTNLPNANLSNAVGVLPLSNGGTGSTNASNARTALQLGSAATNPATAFQPASTALTNLAAGDASGLTNLPNANLGTATGVLGIANGGSAATNAQGARTNFGLVWSGLTNSDAASFRTALSLGTAATNDASAFQPASANLTNLAANNGGSLTNVSVDLTAVLPAYSNNAGKVLAVATGATNVEWTAISNTVTDASALTNFPSYILQTNSSDGSFPSFLLRTNGNASGLTFPASLLTTNGNGSALTNLTAANITGTVALASNVSGTVAVANGGTGAVDVTNARINLLPSYTGNSNRILALNSNATDIIWTTNTSGGSTTIDLSTTNATGILPVSKGGTGGSTAKAALIGLGVYATNGSSTSIALGEGVTIAASAWGTAIGQSASTSILNQARSSAFGYATAAGGNQATALGAEASSGGTESLAIGFRATAPSNNAIQLGQGDNTTANSIQVRNFGNVNSTEWGYLATASSAGGLIMTSSTAAVQRTNLGLPLVALTNDSNATLMRALSGSTNTNHPFSGTVSVVGTNNTNTLVFSNGILQEIQ